MPIDTSKYRFRKAVVAYLIRNEQVLLGERIKVSDGNGSGLWAGIGGKQEGNELPSETLLREVREEIKVKITEYHDRGNIKFIFPHKPKWNQDVDIYVCVNWEGNPVATDVIRPQWFPLTSLPMDKMWIDNQYWVPKILAGKTIQAVCIFSPDGSIKDFQLRHLQGKI